ncbi:MAG: 4-(cytidine 5'-diphospho)-2-C-methyl-D-erythritol kinase [Lachnospiraceae bacterium]|nr:4-(cytidine 5'-diphospho)-2-C-methyl-D-erythritol kinase [Lachnospiraceae bacterium]
MEKIVLRPLAKINLGLDVVGKREDGYHEVRMVMQTLALHDRLVMEKMADGAVTMKTNLPYLPTGRTNLVVQAVELLREEFGISEGIRINLKKVIPVAGGMAGGSTDAAAALYGMNRMFSLGLSKKQLMELGVKLGADVPYCIMRGTALAEGIGEKLTPLCSVPQVAVLVVKPAFSVSTAKVYEAFDQMEDVQHPDIDGLLDAIREKDLRKICQNMGNNLADVTKSMYPVIGDIEKKMEELGAMKAMMSGSGPTVFGFFENQEQANGAKEEFLHRKNISQVYVTSVYNVKREVRQNG